MPTLTTSQKDLIRDEISHLRLFAKRHEQWLSDISDPAERKPHRYVRGELEGLADEIYRIFFGFVPPEPAQDDFTTDNYP